MPKTEDSMDPIWKDLYQEIGVLVVAGGQLEETVRCILLNLLGGLHWRRTSVVANGFSASQMIQGCRSLAGFVLGGSIQTDVLNWLKEVERIQKFRNRVVHSEWVSKADRLDGSWVSPAAIYRQKVRGSELRIDVDAYTAEEIRQAAGDFVNATNEGTNLIVELQDFAWLEHQAPQGDLAPWTRDLPK